MYNRTFLDGIEIQYKVVNHQALVRSQERGRPFHANAKLRRALKEEEEEERIRNEVFISSPKVEF